MLNPKLHYHCSFISIAESVTVARSHPSRSECKLIQAMFRIVFQCHKYQVMKYFFKYTEVSSVRAK